MSSLEWGGASAHHCLMNDLICLPSAPGHCNQQPSYLPVSSPASWDCAHRLVPVVHVHSGGLIGVEARQPCRERE